MLGLSGGLTAAKKNDMKLYLNPKQVNTITNRTARHPDHGKKGQRKFSTVLTQQGTYTNETNNQYIDENRPVEYLSLRVRTLDGHQNHILKLDCPQATWTFIVYIFDGCYEKK